MQAMHERLLEEQQVAVVVCSICSKPLLEDLDVSGRAMHRECAQENPMVPCPLGRLAKQAEKRARLWNSDISMWLFLSHVSYRGLMGRAL